MTTNDLSAIWTMHLHFRSFTMAAIRYFLFFLISFALIVSFLLAYTPLIIPLGFLFMSATSFIFYARDKYAAIHYQWRIPENTLHILSLLGGWPGAIIAQQTLRHKNIKSAFQIKFWLVMIINTVFFVWLHSHKGQSILHTSIRALDNITRNGFATNKFSNTLLYLLQ